MPDTTARLLETLSLLQSRPHWPGSALAERSGVTVRTVRRDVERLRMLGYPIETTVGRDGGYRLGAGGRAMPPLMLDRDEAVAVAGSLRAAASGSVPGGDETAARALAKIEPLLPPALARQVGTIGAMTASLPTTTDPISPEVLVTVTRACRDRERLRVRYTDRDGHVTDRTVDPHRVVSTGRRWYLVAHDRDRGAWRTLRLDRFGHVHATGHRIELHDPPDAVSFVQRAISIEPYRHQVRVEMLAPIDEVRVLVPATTATLEATDGDTTIVVTGSDDIELVAFHLLRLHITFRILEGDELFDALVSLRARISDVLHDGLLQG